MSLSVVSVRPRLSLYLVWRGTASKRIGPYFVVRELDAKILRAKETSGLPFSSHLSLSCC